MAACIAENPRQAAARNASQKSDPAHHTAYYSELVCSNSLRADNIENAVGLLKEEMRRLDSLIMAQADAHRRPRWRALAVDRMGFA